MSSSLGRLLSSMLRCRLQDKCSKEKLIRPEQASSQKGARTSDHLLVFHHIIQKYVKKNGNKKLYVCFLDLRKCYDTVNRVRLFYELLTEFHIGGNFLKNIDRIFILII